MALEKKFNLHCSICLNEVVMLRLSFSASFNCISISIIFYAFENIVLWLFVKWRILAGTCFIVSFLFSARYWSVFFIRWLWEMFWSFSAVLDFFAPFPGFLFFLSLCNNLFGCWCINLVFADAHLLSQSLATWPGHDAIFSNFFLPLLIITLTAMIIYEYH